jgi:hypothetical protein
MPCSFYSLPLRTRPAPARDGDGIEVAELRSSAFRRCLHAMRETNSAIGIAMLTDAKDALGESARVTMPSLTPIRRSPRR